MICNHINKLSINAIHEVPATNLVLTLGAALLTLPPLLIDDIGDMNVLVANRPRNINLVLDSCINCASLIRNNRCERHHNNLVKRLLIRHRNQTKLLGNDWLVKNNLDGLVVIAVAIKKPKLDPLTVALSRTVVKLKLGQIARLVDDATNETTPLALRPEAVVVLVHCLKLHCLWLQHQTSDSRVLLEVHRERNTSSGPRTDVLLIR